eukprot:652548-Rhodomonas_salina.3
MSTPARVSVPRPLEVSTFELCYVRALCNVIQRIPQRTATTRGTMRGSFQVQARGLGPQLGWSARIRFLTVTVEAVTFAGGTPVCYFKSRNSSPRLALQF